MANQTIAALKYLADRVAPGYIVFYKDEDRYIAAVMTEHDAVGEVVRGHKDPAGAVRALKNKLMEKEK